MTTTTSRQVCPWSRHPRDIDDCRKGATKGPRMRVHVDGSAGATQLCLCNLLAPVLFACCLRGQSYANMAMIAGAGPLIAEWKFHFAESLVFWVRIPFNAGIAVPSPRAMVKGGSHPFRLPPPCSVQFGPESSTAYQCICIRP
jgi:hypothetical protein